MRSAIGIAIRNCAVVFRVGAKELAGASVVVKAGDGIRPRLAGANATERQLACVIILMAASWKRIRPTDSQAATRCSHSALRFGWLQCSESSRSGAGGFEAPVRQESGAGQRSSA
jgi:hypothetical protein